MTAGIEVIGPAAGNGAAVALCPALDQVRAFLNRSKSQNTLRGYGSDWRHFCGWTESNGLSSLPASPETVAPYIAQLAGRLKVGSLERRLNAISEAHQAAGLESPTHSSLLIRNLMKGIRRTFGTAPSQKAPTLIEDIRAMMDAADAGLIGLRDRALILLGFAGAFRRSELVGLDVADCVFGRGLTLNLRRAKTDQNGAGRRIGIPSGADAATCPVRSLQEWLEQAAITSGALFRPINRHGKVQNRRLAGTDVARIVKKLVERAGLDPTCYSSTSLRAGHVTMAIINEVPERSIQNQTGHRSVEMLRRYARDADLFRQNSGGKLGL
jgi:site-specific recombinase XerD